jgi:hypothetical protein
MQNFAALTFRAPSPPCSSPACSPSPPHPTLADDDTEAAPKGAAVTVLKVAKSCFADIVEVSGTIIPREET